MIANSAPSNIVTAPKEITSGGHAASSLKAGYMRPIKKTPALTIVAECKYADTGVGAAIAPGSQ